jgi:hypothetical protein
VVVVDAVLPQLLAAVIGVHVEADRVLLPCLQVGLQLDEEPPPLERDLANVDPAESQWHT